MSTPESLEERVARLEDVAFEGDGLTRAVTRLGLNANALGEALLTVDRNQQQLTKLGGELARVQETTATKEEVEKRHRQQEAELRAYRQNVLGKAYLAVVLSMAILGFAGLFLANYLDGQRALRYRECLAAQQQISAVSKFLMAVRDNGTVPEIKETAGVALEEFPPISCEGVR